MKKMKVLLITLITISITFWSCQNEQMPVETDSGISSGFLDKTIDKAVLHLQVVDGANANSYDLNVHKVSKSWTEFEVTWNSPWDTPGGDYSETPMITKFVDKNSYDEDRIIDVEITQLWQGGTPEFGIILKIADDLNLEAGKRLKFSSREVPDPFPSTITTLYPPLVEITYFEGIEKKVTYQVLADAEILAVDGKQDKNYGSKTSLFAGKSVENFQLRSVLNFEFPADDELPGDDLPDDLEKCTYTKSYWKTHAKGKKKDETWDLLKNGTKTKFFDSKKSYYNIISRVSWGNSYYVLASEYVATELNLLAGTNPEDIQSEFDLTTGLFAKYTSKDFKKWWKISKEDREIFMDSYKKLKAYNIGDSGPGHCDDDKWKNDNKDWKVWWKKYWDKKKWNKKKWNKKKWKD